MPELETLAVEISPSRTPAVPPGARVADADRQARLFREPIAARLLRWGLGVAYLLQPKRITDLPALVAGCATSLRRGRTVIPTAADIQPRPDSFAGIARDVTPETLMTAHRAGFFPQAHVGPLKWWTRRQRYVLTPHARQIPSKHRAYLRKSDLVVTFDRAFDEVVKACAEARPGRPRLTWIRPDIMRLYAQLHVQGHAHSFELWAPSGRLVGGGYGVAIGRVFVTESLFSRVPNASRMGLQVLHYHLEKWGFVLNDVKDCAPHFERLGFRHIDREDYEAILRAHAHGASAVGRWQVEADLAAVARSVAPQSGEVAGKEAGRIKPLRPDRPSPGAGGIRAGSV